jgi:phosphoglycolate phosphatase-like HAD superfamily hydrolase
VHRPLNISGKKCLLLFDVDGTLTDTTTVDSDCYLQALADLFGFTEVDGDWSHYKFATDVGIVHEVFESRNGRAPRRDELASFRGYFLQLLRAASRRSPFAAVPGAPELLDQLAKHEGIEVGLATGCWSDAARLKMASAGMSYDDFPGASADDAPDRQTIIKLAIDRIRLKSGGNFAAAIYIGDGLWDARACRDLQIPFIGVASGAQKRQLALAGAVDVFADLRDSDAIIACIKQISLDL